MVSQLRQLLNSFSFRSLQIELFAVPVTIHMWEYVALQQTSALKHFERKSQRVFLSVRGSLDKSVLTEWGIPLINGCSSGMKIKFG